MRNMMVDLETMGTSVNAPIIAIGAVFFDQEGTGAEFYKHVSLESSVNAGAVIDPSTVLWWLKQSDQARSAFVDNGSAEPLGAALIEFSKFCHQVKNPIIWGNGAAFDNVILANAYEGDAPWKFWNDRCYRTIKSLYSNIPMTRSGTHHNALDDARDQANHLIEICNLTGITLEG